MGPEDLEGIAGALDDIGERLADLAFECLRNASEAADPSSQLAEERRLRQAIRGVQRAAAILRRSRPEEEFG